MMASHGMDLQEKSKQSLLRSLNKVHDTNNLAMDAVLNLEKQNQQILRINDKIQEMEGTLQRTKKHLRYFGKSFCKDKIAISLMGLIILTILAIGFVWFYVPDQSEQAEAIEM